MTLAFGLIGAGGFAREVMPMVRAEFPKAELFFVETTPGQKRLNGLKVVSEAEFIQLPYEKLYAIAIADAAARSQISARIAVRAKPHTLLADTCRIGDSNIIAEGAILCHFTTVTANAKIGKHFHANIYSYVAHDCVIGDYVTFAPNVQCNGNVMIGNNVYVGTGAMIRQGITIGDNAVIGMGAVVVKNVPANTTVVGNPAKPLARK